MACSTRSLFLHKKHKLRHDEKLCLVTFYRCGNTLRFPWARDEPPREKPTHCGVSSSSLSHRSLRVFPSLVLRLRSIGGIKIVIEKTALYHITSPGERRVVTPAGTARVRRPRRVFFSRRLRPCPRKASARSDPGRRVENKFVTSHFTETAILVNNDINANNHLELVTMI